MKLTKTDHNEQALVINQRTKYLIREAFGAMLDNQVGSVEMRDEALQMKRMLEDPTREDKPAIFQKSFGQMITCPDCAGARSHKLFPEDRDAEIELSICSTCKGEGQLFQEIIRKAYVPTEYHRRKLAK
jgi:hypothetical protein